MLIDPRIHVRLAFPDDVGRVRTMAGALSRQSVCLRFLGGVSREFAIEELGSEILAGRAKGEALVAEDEQGAIVGEAYAAYLGRGEAEAAFVVSDAWQHHGIGTGLRAALFDRLRSEGIKTIYLEALAENTSLLHLVRDAGLPTEERYGGGTVRLRVTLAS